MAKKVEKKEKGFCGVKGLTEDMLTAAAEDLNDSLGLNPAIDVEDLEGEDLLEAVKVSMEEVYENDQLEEGTWTVMKLLGIEAQPTPEEEAPAKEEPKKGKGKKAPAVEPEDDDEAPAPKAKKGKKVVEPEPEEEDDDEAPAPAKKGKAAKEEKPAPKKAPDAPKYSRSDAFGEALMAGKKNKKSLAQIVEASDTLYSEATGRRSNPKEATWCANLSLKALAACGYVTVDGDAIEILVRP
jgi:outer membrane biosynthesis protein TonB